MQEVKHKKLSLLSYIIIFLVIVIVTILLVQKLDVSAYSASFESDYIYNSNYDVVSEENEMYIKNIKLSYGINIVFGKDAYSFANSIDATAQYDKNIINNNVKAIYYELKKYPIDTFDMVKEKKYPMYIMLLDKFNNDNLAIASKSSLNVFRLYISNTEKFERAFHHEMYHILEYYMQDQNKYIFSSWYRLNPDRFNYEENVDKLTTEFVYNNAKNQSGYFITKYSKTSDKEDRAELFADVMCATKKPEFMESSNVSIKVKFIKSILNEYISKNDFYFYKYI